VQPKWFEAGAKDYGFPPLALLSLEFLLMGFLELKRYQGFKKTGKVEHCCPVFMHADGS
jgi:light-harvesting complex I chlorophyll a/b binding protein 5